MTRKPTKFAHVVYRTRRFEEMIGWYETVFGATVQHENPVIAFLTYDDEHHRFAFLNLAAIDPAGNADADKRAAVGVDHVAYTVASLTDLLGNYAELKARDIAPYWCVHHGLTASMYYADPDGNQMEFQVDAFADDGCNDKQSPSPLPSTTPLLRLSASASPSSSPAEAPTSERSTRPLRTGD